MFSRYIFRFGFICTMIWINLNFLCLLTQCIICQSEREAKQYIERQDSEQRLKGIQQIETENLLAFGGCEYVNKEDGLLFWKILNQTVRNWGYVKFDCNSLGILFQVESFVHFCYLHTCYSFNRLNVLQEFKRGYKESL